MKRLKFILLALICTLQLPLMASNPQETPEAKVAQLAVARYPWAYQNQNKLVAQHFRESEVGYHLLFQQYYGGIMVYGATLKLNTDKQYNVLSEFNDLIDFKSYAMPTGIPMLPEMVWYVSNGKVWAAKLSVLKNNKGEVFEELRTINDSLLQSKMLSLNARKDTAIKAKVFLPDPLTSAQKTYGEDGMYKNYGGADATELNAQRKTESMLLEFENGTFYAANPYIVIKDLESPSQTVFQSTQANFDFTRSQSQFREFNCLYHIEVFRNYLKSINIPLTGMGRIEVDPTAYQGFDQSRFDYSGTTPGLFFGTGGVPDAEDADVIIHEYTHGINYFIAPNTTNGSQRLALEEANCDVMACLYSKNISRFNWRQIFNWDGHNEYWDGRDGDTDKKYPNDISSDFYETSLIWSSMLNDLSEDIGRNAVTLLLFQTVYSYANNMTMQNAADLLVQADSLLFDKWHYPQLKTRLIERGFQTYIGVTEHNGISQMVKLVNSYGFANGTDDLQLFFKQPGAIQVKVFDMTGKLIQEFNTYEQSLRLDPADFAPGCYAISVEQNNLRGNAKIMRY